MGQKKMAKGIFGKLVFFLNVGFIIFCSLWIIFLFYCSVMVAFLQEGVIVSGAFWFLVRFS